MEIRPIYTEADFDWALAEIEAYFVTEPDNRKRALTTEMIYKLSRQWGMPAESLTTPITSKPPDPPIPKYRWGSGRIILPDLLS